MSAQDSKPKAPTLTELRRWRRCLKSWKRCESNFNQASAMVQSLGILQEGTAFAHFIGGCSHELQINGAVSRKAFIRLLLAAHEFASKIK